ncbi:MAG: protein-S-isoprenylcysteine O-methyltransferase Ste14 [Halieaceae bacterium]|jgi:protein-S-isoprenylcysteine O-methyltransferase Ste14
MSKPTRIIYPPIWLVIGLGVIFSLDYYLPVARYTGQLGWVLGGISILLGLVLLIQAGGLFKQAETDLIPFKEVTTLVTSGIYAYTRNPMYLGMTLVLLGTALTVGAASALIVPPVFMLVIQVRFILPEEEMLFGIFAEQFVEYRKQVRRWF